MQCSIAQPEVETHCGCFRCQRIHEASISPHIGTWWRYATCVCLGSSACSRIAASLLHNTPSVFFLVCLARLCHRNDVVFQQVGLQKPGTEGTAPSQLHGLDIANAVVRRAQHSEHGSRHNIQNSDLTPTAAAADRNPVVRRSRKGKQGATPRASAREKRTQARHRQTSPRRGRQPCCNNHTG